MRTNIIALLGALGLCLLPETEAHALSFTEIIPASACQLEDEEDIGKADLVDGSWLISASTANDEIELLCPVRIPPFAVEGITKSLLAWSHMEIFYRDPDGTSTSHSVKAFLSEISSNAAFPTLLGTVSSDANPASTTTDARYDDVLTFFGTNLADAQHFVRVVMKQGSNNGSNRVRFTRVRLFAAPPESP